MESSARVGPELLASLADWAVTVLFKQLHRQLAVMLHQIRGKCEQAAYRQPNDYPKGLSRRHMQLRF